MNVRACCDAPEDGDEEAGRQVGDAQGDGGLVLALVARGDRGRGGQADNPADWLKKHRTNSYPDVHGGPAGFYTGN